MGAKMRSGMLSAIAGTAMAFIIGLATASQAAPVLYSATGSGQFRVFPIAPTVLLEDQSLTLVSVLPFPLTVASYQGFVDLTKPTFPDRVFNAKFTQSNGFGDSLTGTYTVDTQTFIDPVDPFAGDFIGSEDFTGSFTFTGGTGLYFGATGGGTYVGHSDYTAFDPAALFSGTSTLTATGRIDFIPEPVTLS